MAAIDEIYDSIQDILKNYKARRDQDMQMFWHFYEGYPQRYYFRQFAGESTDDYWERISHAVIENHCKPTCDIATSYLYGVGKILRRCKDSNAQRLMNERIWVLNNMEEFMYDVALMASITGFALISLSFVDVRTGMPFEITSRDEYRDFGAVKYKLIDSMQALPLPRNDNQRELGAMILAYEADNYSGLTAFDRLTNKEFKEIFIIEYIDDEFWLKWQEDKLVPTNPGTEWLNRNMYGDVRIPFVIFQNPGDPMELVGDPDHLNIITLNNELNERSNDDANVISFHSFPVLKFLRGAQMPKNWTRTANSALEFSGDQDAEYLTWDNELEASKNRQETLRRNIARVSGISDLSRGNTEGINQVRSSAGLKTMFQSDVLTIMRKRIKARKAEKWLIRATLQMLEFYFEKEFESYEAEIDFPEDFLGLDELLKAQAQQIRLSTAVEGLDEIIRKEHPELPDDRAVMERVQKNIELNLKKEVGVKAPETPEKKAMEQEVGSEDLQNVRK